MTAATPPPLRLAIVGAGAITELGHLPAAAAVPQVKVVALVDRNLPRATELARRFDIPHAVGDIANLPDSAGVEAALVAVPHALHAPLTIALLHRGLHVLVEKPMALTTDQCDAMIAAARDAKRTLAVGLVRRFMRSTRLTKSLLEAGILGEIESFAIDDCGLFNWPAASPALFDPQIAGGGVLMDAGVHALDTLLWWLGQPVEVHYRDDSAGGVEAECEVSLTFASGAAGTVRLSRLRDLPKQAVITGRHGQLSMPLHDDKLALQLHGQKIQWQGNVTALPGAVDTSPLHASPLAAQLADFAHAIATGTAPSVTAEEGRRSVELIQRCYQQRQPLLHTWMQPSAEGQP